VLGCHRNLFLVRRPVVATGTGPALMTDFATDLREIFDATMELSPEVGDGGNRKGGISWGA